MSIEENKDSASSDGTVLVTTVYTWKKIKKDSPFGLRCLLINKKAGSFYSGILSRSDTHSTHYAAAPKFDPDEK